jgi:hypothetical protein
MAALTIAIAQVFSGVLQAADTITDAPPAPVVAAPTPTTTETSPNVTAPVPDSTSSAVTTEKGPFDWLDSRLPIHFTLDFTSYYDDNIFISPVKTDDYVFHISPGVTYSFGEEGESDNYLALKYVPTVIEYYTNSQQDAVNQNADMLYEHNFKKLKLSLEQNYAHTNDTSIQAGTIVVGSVYDTIARASYDYSDKLSIQADFDQSLSYYPNPGYNNIYEWSGGAYFLYQITPKISLGVGPRAGYVAVPTQPGQTWEQGLVHLTYNVTEKISLNASAGGEVRQFDTSIPDQVTGVFNLGAYWTPFQDTSLNIGGYRKNDPSYSIGGSNFTATGVTAGIRQTFLENFAIGVNGGYENDDYTAASLSVTGARSDDYYYIHPYFQWNPERFFSLTAFYQYSANDSNLKSVTFNDNQVGTSLTFRY